MPYFFMTHKMICGHGSRFLCNCHLHLYLHLYLHL